MKAFHFRGLWRDSWIEPARVNVDAKGVITSIEAKPAVAGDEVVDGWALPGIPNAHSHAFQAAMAGRAEFLPPGSDSDDFWSWREAMYDRALALTPESASAIAGFLYGALAARGFTSVAEFHYLHLDPDGNPYADPLVLAKAHFDAASRAGIRLTLVPVHYQTGDFDQPASARQRRFLFKGADAYLKHAEAVAIEAKRRGHRSGGGVHSLRASPREETLAVFRGLARDLPRHLHIAEQKKEVEAGERAWGKRPLTWALENLGLDERFHLVHATHATESELKGVASSGAHVVLCPTTEGNLGDGLFPLKAYRSLGGKFSIGTDSHIGVDPFEELRLLEYGQRLHHLAREPLCRPGEDAGEILFAEAVRSGRKAVGEGGTALAVGSALDAAVVSAREPAYAGSTAARRISIRVFTSMQGPLFGTLVGGKWVAREGRSVSHASLAEAFRKSFGR